MVRRILRGTVTSSNFYLSVLSLHLDAKFPRCEVHSVARSKYRSRMRQAACASIALGGADVTESRREASSDENASSTYTIVIDVLFARRFTNASIVSQVVVRSPFGPRGSPTTSSSAFLSEMSARISFSARFWARSQTATGNGIAAALSATAQPTRTVPTSIPTMTTNLHHP